MRLRRKIKEPAIALKLGNSLELLKNIHSGSIDLIVTDPPYEVTTTNGGGTVNTIKKLKDSLQDLKEGEVDLTQGYDIEAYGEEFIRVMKEVNIYVWCNKAQIPKYLDFYVTRHKCKFDILCWHKTNALPTYSNKYLTDTEYLLYFRKGKGKCFPETYEDAKTYYVAPINHKDKKMYGHPTIKPLDLTEKIIRNSSREGQTVLDPFMGSGTTGVACVNTDRKFIGMELDEKYFDLSEDRIATAKSQKIGE